MPQRLGLDSVPATHAFVPPTFWLGRELSGIRSIDPEVSTRRRTSGIGRCVALWAWLGGAASAHAPTMTSARATDARERDRRRGRSRGRASGWGVTRL